MTAVSTLRAEEGSDCAYLFLIEGISTGWVTPHRDGDLLGTNWAGAVHGGGGHTIRPGLSWPSWSAGFDPISGMPRTKSATFQIHEDPDNPTTLIDIFATAGATVSTLIERVSPTMDVTSVDTSEGIGEDLTGMSIGLETIGPNAERRHWFPIPAIPELGLDHPVCATDYDLLPPITVSAAPTQFAGRLCCLYRIFRDIHSTTGGYEDWPNWTLQFNGGGLAWIGRLKDAGQVGPDKTWTLQCGGWDSLLKKALNTATVDQWFPVSADLDLDDGADSGKPEDEIAIHLEAIGAVTGDWKTFDGKHFRDGDQLTDTGSKSALASEIDGLIADAIGNTNCNFTGPDNEFENYDDSRASMSSQDISVRKNSRLYTNNPTICRMRLVLHEKVWNFLGYEPAVQGATDWATDFERAIWFIPLQNGENYMGEGQGNVPGPGYWEGWFNTSQGGHEGNWSKWDNDGADRIYKPWYTGGISVLNQNADQEIYLHGAANTYVEPQLCWPALEKEVDGTAVGESSVRYFLFKGPIETGDGEVRDMAQVGRCLIRLHSAYGSIYTDVQPTVYLERWMDPMAWGLNQKPLETSWASSNGGEEGQIMAKPIALLGMMPNNIADYAHLVWLRLMLSTGTSTGWTGYADDPTAALDRGNNSHGFAATPGATWGDDLEIADLGLGIPEEIVADPLDVAAEFARVTGGGWTDGLCRGKWILDGPAQAWDVLRGITEPLRLYWTFHGGKFGLRKFGPNSASDVTLTEDDLHTKGGPSTSLRVGSPIDAVDLNYRYDLEAESPADTLHARARDAEARSRIGDSLLTIDAPGILSEKWFQHRPGAESMKLVTDADPWSSEFRRLWEREAATMMAKRHFSVENLVVSRAKGLELQPGTRVRLTNQWVVDGSGSYGITALPGIVTDISVNTKAETYTARVLVFDDAFAGMRHFAAIGRVKRVSGGVVTLWSDARWQDHGEGTPASFFDTPDWDALGGSPTLRFLHYNRNAWEMGQTMTLDSVDGTANTLTVSAMSGSYNERDKETLVCFETHDNQAAAWVKGHHGVVVLSNHKHGGTPTMGWPYH
jgi:hypothetical protein